MTTEKTIIKTLTLPLDSPKNLDGTMDDDEGTPLIFFIFIYYHGREWGASPQEDPIFI